MLRVLVDNGIVSASDFAEGASRTETLQWGSGSTTVQIAGFRRVPPQSDPDEQLQRDALFTVGRLARQGELELYTYFELMAEQWRRGKGRDQVGNAFRGYVWKRCEAALERSCYFRGLSMEDVIAKGDRKDRKAGKNVRGTSQIDFCKFLLALGPQNVEELISLGPPIVRSEFEERSLRDLDWFRRAVRVAPSEENLPDFLHLWTARRNDMDVFLTLEVRLPRYASDLRKLGLLDSFSVARPVDFLRSLGICELDAVPLEVDRFYSFGELVGRPFDGWHS